MTLTITIEGKEYEEHDFGNSIPPGYRLFRPKKTVSELARGVEQRKEAFRKFDQEIEKVIMGPLTSHPDPFAEVDKLARDASVFMKAGSISEQQCAKGILQDFARSIVAVAEKEYGQYAEDAEARDLRMDQRIICLSNRVTELEKHSSPNLEHLFDRVAELERDFATLQRAVVNVADNIKDAVG